MKTYENNIKGKKYLYASDTIYINKGKILQKNKSLGPIDSLKNTAFKKNEFFKYLMREEAKLRTTYWSKYAKNRSFKEFITVDKIEELRAKLYRSKKNIGDIGSSVMEMAFLVDFIYNSNKIEGSRVPRENVEEIVKSGSNNNEEVSNTIEAVKFVNNNFKFSLKDIEKLHSVILNHEPGKKGFRKKKIVVANSEVLEWKEIKKTLQKLLLWYKENKFKMYPPELAFTFYYKYERIHPFVDGNGRTGRLIMNKILKDHRYHPIIIWNKRRRAHISAFEKSMEGRDHYYFKFMSEEMIKTYEIYIEKIDKAYSLENQMEYFFKPSKYNID